jgi:hypothetical protein
VTGGADGGQVDRPARYRVPRRPQPGQILLAGAPDPLPDRGEPVVADRGERAQHDRDQAGQRVDPPLRRARARQCLQLLSRPRGQLLATAGTGLDHARPARDNANAGMPHLVHADFRDLHDQVACPRPSTVRFRPVSYMSPKTGNSRTSRSPAQKPPLARTLCRRGGFWPQPDPAATRVA